MRTFGEFKDYLLAGVVAIFLSVIGWIGLEIRDDFKGIRTEIGAMTQSINTLNIRLETINTDQSYMKAQGVDHEVRIRELERVKP